MRSPSSQGDQSSEVAPRSRQRGKSRERPHAVGQIAEVVVPVDRPIVAVLPDGGGDQVEADSSVVPHESAGGEPFLERFQQVATMEIDQEFHVFRYTKKR